MNNAKVTVTKEVAEALAIQEKNGISVRSMLRHNVHGDLYGVYAPLQTMGVDDLARALLFGYEVEKSPEGKVREFYEDSLTRFTDTHGVAMRIGIRDTLDILGIKIEGVNA